MNLKEYQIAAFRTCPDLVKPYEEFIPAHLLGDLSRKLNLSHMVEGMGSELSELDDAQATGDRVNIAEEMADIMWYVAGYCTWRNYDLMIVCSLNNKAYKSLSWYVHELTDLVKKFVAYNKIIDPTKEMAYIGAIVFWCQEVLGEQGFNVAIKNNIDKLRVRYPEKFSDEAAVNRNLDAERRELEK